MTVLIQLMTGEVVADLTSLVNPIHVVVVGIDCTRNGEFFGDLVAEHRSCNCRVGGGVYAARAVPSWEAFYQR